MIVCATRGGEGSRALIKAAIDEAKEINTSLLFLFVANPDVFSGSTTNIDQSMMDELRWVGGVVLRLMRLRAREQGVDANIKIVEGSVNNAIVEYVKQQDVDRLFVGAPFGITTDVFGDDEIEKFAIRVENETAVPVKIIHAPSASKRSANKTTFS